MAGLGYVIAIPVFCDSAFILLSALMRQLAAKTGTALSACAVALSLGLYATHTMVPPTPGPVAAAGLLGADLALTLIWGLIVSFCALIAGWLFAVRVAARISIPADALPITPESQPHAQPSTLRSLLPIVLPIILILLRAIAELPAAPFGSGRLAAAIGLLGQPAVALLLGAGVAFLLPRPFSRQRLSSQGWVGEAIASAATILVVTGAGGAFGRVLQISGIADVFGSALTPAPLGILLPFLIAAAIKTAQGSSTVAIITSASLVAPLLPSLGLDGSAARALVVVAIGAGAMVVSHANDSYFWVVTQFSGMDVRTGYRLHTLGTLVQGAAAALVVALLGFFALPLLD
jgi:GntP family gluconate:H+ symporter